MIRVTRSAVIDAPIERVWAVLRDFNRHHAWHPAVAESAIEGGDAPDQVGCVRRFTLPEAIEILEARAALESLAAGYAALRRTPEQARELESLVDGMEALHAAGELLAASERNAVMHRRILEISGHRIARDICGRLNSQMVRL